MSCQSLIVWRRGRRAFCGGAFFIVGSSPKLQIKINYFSKLIAWFSWVHCVITLWPRRQCFVFSFHARSRKPAIIAQMRHWWSCAIVSSDSSHLSRNSSCANVRRPLFIPLHSWLLNNLSAILAGVTGYWRNRCHQTMFENLVLSPCFLVANINLLDQHWKAIWHLLCNRTIE